MGNNLNIGLVGVGLDTYWEQFDGLKERLIGYQNKLSEKMVSMNVNVINIPMLDSQQKAHETVKLLLDKKIDMLFIFISTYALSSTILPVVQECRVSGLLLNIQPTAAIDFKFVNGLNDRGRMTGEWLAYCQTCSIPEFAVEGN